ncbi:MAG TPA: septum formation initiator family protein [Actinopolymorphaceae bacterium]
MAGPSKQGPSSRRPTGRTVDGRARGSGRPAASARSTGGAATAKGAAGSGGTGAATAAPTNASTRSGQRRWTGRAAVLVIILAALIVSYASSLRAWVDQQQQMSALRVEQADQTERVGELKDEINRWNDSAFVKAQARERFGYVMLGEVGYVVLDDKTVATTTTTTMAKVAAATPWWQQLWGSVGAADKVVPGSGETGPGGATVAPTPKPTPTPEKTLGPTPTRHR